jgi:hypothetical protein
LHLFNSNKSRFLHGNKLDKMFSLLLITFLIAVAFIGLVQIPIVKAIETGFFGTSIYGNDNYQATQAGIVYSAYTVPYDIYANNMSACWTQYGGSLTSKAMIFNATDGTLIGTTSENTANPSDFTFISYNYTTEPLIPSGTEVYLAIWVDAWFRVGVSYNADSDVYFQNITYGNTPPSTITGSIVMADRDANINCGYTQVITPYLNFEVQRQKAGETANIAINWQAPNGATLNNAVSILESNTTGTKTNSTAISLSGAAAWGNTTITMPNVNDVVSLTFYGNDSNNLWRSTNTVLAKIYSNDMAVWIEGNKAFNGNGTQVNPFKGYDYTYLMDDANGSWMNPTDGSIDWSIYDESLVNKTLNFLVASHNTPGTPCIRLLMTVEFWMDNNSSYRTHITRFIELAQARNIYVIPCFWRVYSLETSGTPTYFPWNPYTTANAWVNTTADFTNVWTNFANANKAYNNWMPDYWNEPFLNSTTATEWWGTSQNITNAIRSLGILSPINVGAAPNNGPLTYDFNSGYTEGFGSTSYVGYAWFPTALASLNDTSNNFMYDMHCYRNNAYESGNPGWYAWNESSVFSWLNQTQVINASKNYVINIGEIGSNNGMTNRTEELAWYNNTLHIFDDYGIGYQQWAAPPWSIGSTSYTWGFVNFNQANFTLTDIGQVWLTHLGGTTYSVYLQSLVGSSPIDATPEPTRTKAQIATDQVFTNMYIALGLIGAGLIIISAFIMLKSMGGDFNDSNGSLVGVGLLITTLIGLVLGFVIINAFQNSTISIMLLFWHG